MTVHLTNHARERAAEMGVPTKRIKRMFRDPRRIDYPSMKYPNCRIAVLDDLAIPYNPTTGTVITVLWNQEVSR